MIPIKLMHFGKAWGVKEMGVAKGACYGRVELFESKITIFFLLFPFADQTSVRANNDQINSNKLEIYGKPNDNWTRKLLK